MASSKESFKYWKHENVFFVSTGEDGSAKLPALIFPSIHEVGFAMKELQENREALHVVENTPQVESECQLKFLEIVLQGEPSECLIWLDPMRKPRIETVDATRPRVTFQEGFIDWAIAMNLLTGNVDGYVRVMYLMAKQAQDEKKSKEAPVPSATCTDGTKTTSGATTTEQTSAKSSSPVKTLESNEESLKVTADLDACSQQKAKSEDTAGDKSKSVGDEIKPMDTTEDSIGGDPMAVDNTQNRVNQYSAAKSSESDQAVSTETKESIAATPLQDSVMGVEKPDTTKESEAEESQTDDNRLADPQDEMVFRSDTEESTMKSPSGKQGKKNKTKAARVSMTPARRSSRKVTSPSSGNSNSVASVNEGEEEFEFVGPKQVISLLKRAGFTIEKNHYALSEHSEGFSSLENLRRDICLHGMPDSDEWNNDDRNLLEKWIRQSIFRSGDYTHGLPDNYEEVGDFKDMRKVAGFQYYDLSGLGCRYTYPGVSKQDSGILSHGVFCSEQDLMVSLARHGLPEDLYQKLSPEKLLGLEVYVDMKVYPKLKPNFFSRELPYSESPRKRNRAGLSDESVNSERRSPSNRRKKLLKTSNLGDASHPMATPTKSAKAEVEPSTPMTTSTTSTNMVSVDALPWPPSLDLETEIAGATDFERLEKAEALLGKVFSVPVFDTESSLGLNIKKVHDMVGAVLRSAGRHGGDYPVNNFDQSHSSKALYVCGVPGTGKTMSISWICQYLLQAQKDGKIPVERDDDEEDIDWKFLIQNANQVADVETFRRKMTDTIGRNGKLGGVLKKKKFGLILVVDEIDSMVGQAERELFLSELLGYANNEAFHFALIGISNSVMDEKYVKIRQFGKFRPTITFSSYSNKELQAILRHRIGSKLMDERALEFIAKKCMNEGGDVRRALDLTLAVVKARLERLGDDTTSLSAGPVIGFKDVFALSQAENLELVNRISGLPEVSKACLVALSALGQVQVTETTIGKLKSFVGQCTREGDDFFDPNAFVLTLETLKDSGLLRLNASSVVGMSPRDQQNVVLNLGLQLEDVQFAVDKVCKSDHYQKIANLAKQHKETFVLNH